MCTRLITLFCCTLLITCCGKIPERPEGEACVIDASDNTCLRFATPKRADKEWKYLGDKPVPNLKVIDKHFCFSDEYMVKFKRWAVEVQDYAKKKCK